MANRKKGFQGHSLVIKSNELVQLSQTTMTLGDLRAFTYLVTQIDRDNMYFDAVGDLSVTFRKADFCQKVGILSGSGGNNKHLIDTLERLSQSIFKIESGATIDNIPVLSIASYDKGAEKLTISFNKKILPHLINLKKNFTTYRFENVLPLKSRHAFRLYEFLKSFHQPSATVYIGKLMTIFGTNANAAVIIRDCIRPAVKEINEKTDLYITFEKKKEGRTVTAIVFNISEQQQHAVADDDEEEVVFYGVPQSKTAPVVEQLALDI